jgi:hypothetical protein
MSVGVSRRDILKTLALTAAGGSVLQVIPAQAAEYAHQAVRKDKAGRCFRQIHAKIFHASPVRNTHLALRNNYSQR